MEFKAGDKVRITPMVTDCPWKGQLSGTILSGVEDDGTIAIEVESTEMLGHHCFLGSVHPKKPTGWWFMPKELELIGD